LTTLTNPHGEGGWSRTGSGPDRRGQSQITGGGGRIANPRASPPLYHKQVLPISPEEQRGGSAAATLEAAGPAPTLKAWDEKEWSAAAIAVAGLAIWRSDLPEVVRIFGYVVLLVAGVGELALVTAGYLCRRAPDD
jgi:hypothetical protein